MDLAHNALMVLIALAIDALVGDPDRVWRRIAHPIVLIGRGVAALDRRLNRLDLDESERRRRGVVAITVVALAALATGAVIAWTLTDIPFGVFAEGAVASVFLAQKSLYQHVAAVRSAFAAGGLDAARKAVSMIVGRDPKRLDEAGVSRAAIESLAENFADGVVAPALWGVVLGLPGIIAYKAINTADSMIGHKTERHLAFGRAAARFDDYVNLAPARLSGAIVVVAALLTRRPWRTAWTAMRRDAPRHASPNAGWPEAATGGALGLALGGPRSYGGRLVDDPYMNRDGDPQATPQDIGRALRLYLAACAVHAALWAIALAVFI